MYQRWIFTWCNFTKLQHKKGTTRDRKNVEFVCISEATGFWGVSTELILEKFSLFILPCELPRFVANQMTLAGNPESSRRLYLLQNENDCYFQDLKFVPIILTEKWNFLMGQTDEKHIHKEDSNTFDAENGASYTTDAWLSKHEGHGFFVRGTSCIFHLATSISFFRHMRCLVTDKSLNQSWNQMACLISK